MKKVALILSGCGVMDGSEIHESVVTMLAIERAGATYECLSFDHDQRHVVNHVTGEVTDEQRNMLVESARIARGNVKDIAGAFAEDYDALILPGGMGAAKNLCDYALHGADMTVHPELKRFMQEAAACGKPIGAICISPVLLAQVFGPEATVTIGTNPEDIRNIKRMGAAHIECRAEDVCIDPVRKLVTVPAYMLAQSISQAATGIERLVREVLIRA